MEPESIVKASQVLALERDSRVQAPCRGAAGGAGGSERAGEPEAEGGPTGRSGSGRGMTARPSQEPGGLVRSGLQPRGRSEISLRQAGR